MSASKTWDMYAHWIDGKYRSAFMDFNANLEIVKLYGDHPIHRVRVTLVEGKHDGIYWGWLDTDGKHLKYVHPSRDAVEVCFPYGSKREEERGRGKIVGLLVDDLGGEA